VSALKLLTQSFHRIIKDFISKHRFLEALQKATLKIIATNQQVILATMRLEREPAEAETVRRIFQLYRSGESLKRIAWRLNAEGEIAFIPKDRAHRRSAPRTKQAALLWL
jgi:hypothetical protein